MEKVILDPAIKFGAGRYRQEEHLLEKCGKEIVRFGKKPYIIAGKRAWEAVRERLVPGMEEEKLEYVLEIYPGTCSYEAAKEYAEKCIQARCDEIVGIGGGVIMDFAKAVGEYTRCGGVNVPTSITSWTAYLTKRGMSTRVGAKKD